MMNSSSETIAESEKIDRGEIEVSQAFLSTAFEQT
jgi:hypothetical protein